jgi:uncharacterized membrane protein YccC
MRVTGNAMAGGGVGAVLAWGWNGLFPDYQMPAEVAAALAPLVGAVVAWAVSWVPKSSS